MALSSMEFGSPVAITQSDSTVLDPPLKAIVITATGNVKITSGGVDAALVVAAAPWTPPFTNITKVWDTGTDVTNANLWGVR